MEINVVCTEKPLVHLSRANHYAVTHRTPFPLAGVALATQWLPSITFVKSEKLAKFILINTPLCIAHLQQECHN